LTRRQFVVASTVGAAVLTVLPAPALRVVAQDATPSTRGLADWGLPALDITVSSTGYEGIPEALDAGRYLVTVTATDDTGEFGVGVGFVQPAGMSAEDFLSLLAGPPADATSDDAASPVADTEATPADAGGAGGPPAALFEATIAGGAYAVAGAPSQIVLDLTPGEWIAWGDDPEASQTPVIFVVSGEMPADLVEPESSATITMGEYVIEVTDGALTAGSQVVRIDNIGAQPHFVIAAKGPDGMTEDQIQTILDEEMAAEMSGTPAAYSGINPDTELEDAFFTGTQSTGTSTWIPVTLDAGTYVLVCFFPDMGDGLPHAYHGMYSIVEVGG
jgi:hypothetical protein